MWPAYLNKTRRIRQSCPELPEYRQQEFADNYVDAVKLQSDSQTFMLLLVLWLGIYVCKYVRT